MQSLGRYLSGGETGFALVEGWLDPTQGWGYGEGERTMTV